MTALLCRQTVPAGGDRAASPGAAAPEPDMDLFAVAGLVPEPVPEPPAAPVPEPPVVVLRQIEVAIFPDGTMTRDNAARYLGISRHTLAGWAHQKTGPRYMKLRRKSYYRKSDLDAWKATQFA